MYVKCVHNDAKVIGIDSQYTHHPRSTSLAWFYLDEAS